MDGSNDQFAGMRHASWHKIENVLALVDSLKEHGFLSFDVTGGEPGAYPHIVDVVERASKIGLAPRIITLGQFLGTKNLLERLLDAGLVDFRFSLHSSDPETFHAMTGGDFSKLLAAMDTLEKNNFQYVTNTTITERNYKSLPQIAKFIASREEVYQATLIELMPYYQWQKTDRTKGVRVPYSKVLPYLTEAVEILEASGIAATVRYAPQCLVKGLERNHVGVLGVRYDPHEWMNNINHTADPYKVDPAMMREMGKQLVQAQINLPLFQAAGAINGSPIIYSRPNAGKGFPEKCRWCKGIHVCDGIDGGYMAEYGSVELHPYVENRGNVIDKARLKYTAAFVEKMAQYADAKSVVRHLLKETINVDTAQSVAP